MKISTFFGLLLAVPFTLAVHVQAAPVQPLVTLPPNTVLSAPVLGVRRALTQSLQALKSGDLAGYTAIYAPQARSVNLQPGQGHRAGNAAQTARHAAVSFLQGHLAGAPEFKITKFRVLSPHRAEVTGVEQIDYAVIVPPTVQPSGQTTNNSPHYFHQTNYRQQWVYQNYVWRIQSAQILFATQTATL